MNLLEHNVTISHYRIVSKIGAGGMRVVLFYAGEVNG